MYITKLFSYTSKFKYFMHESESCLVMSNSLLSHELYRPWNSPGQNTGVVACPFSRGSSQPRDQTQVFCIAGRFFTNRATRETLDVGENQKAN